MELLDSFLIPKGDGRAFVVQVGQHLRLTQPEGPQVIDFDAFNLHDYKEHMDVSVSRGSVGFRPAKGNIIFSNPPRFRPMLAILEMPSTCVTDLLGRTCNAVLFEASHGLTVHTACQDTLAESIGEYGLTPDDVVLTSGLNQVRPGQAIRTGGAFDPRLREQLAAMPKVPVVPTLVQSQERAVVSSAQRCPRS